MKLQKFTKWFISIQQLICPDTLQIVFKHFVKKNSSILATQGELL